MVLVGVSIIVSVYSIKNVHDLSNSFILCDLPDFHSRLAFPKTSVTKKPRLQLRVSDYR